MTTALDRFDAEQPMDPRLAMAIEYAFQNMNLAAMEFIPAPRAWKSTKPRGGNSGPGRDRKARIKIGLARRHGAHCSYCGRGFIDLDQATLDHVIPHAIVRHWQEWNLVLACTPCNQAKADMLPVPLVPLLGYLLANLARTRRARRMVRTARRRHNRAARNTLEQIAALSGRPYRLAIEAGQ